MAVTEPTFGINKLYRRQTEASKFSYFDGTDEELLSLIRLNFPLKKKGNREGTWRISISTKGMANNPFYSAVRRIDHNNLLTAECYTSPQGRSIAAINTIGSKQIAAYAEFIIWSKEALEAVGQSTTTKDYEVVSLRASDVPEQPNHPYDIATQVLSSPKGTSGFTLEELAESILYWSERAFVKKEFRQCINKEIVNLLKLGDLNAAVAHRLKQFPNESPNDAKRYVTNVNEFVIITGNNYK